MNYIKGTYIKEIYTNKENGYVVGILKLKDTDLEITTSSHYQLSSKLPEEVTYIHVVVKSVNLGSSCCGSAEVNLTSIHKDA